MCVCGVLHSKWVDGWPQIKSTRINRCQMSDISNTATCAPKNNELTNKKQDGKWLWNEKKKTKTNNNSNLEVRMNVKKKQRAKDRSPMSVESQSKQPKHNTQKRQSTQCFDVSWLITLWKSMQFFLSCLTRKWKKKIK